LRAPRNPILALGLSALLLAAGCGISAAPTATARQATLSAQHRAGFVTAQGISLFVEPEAGAGPILDAINGAKTHIDLEVYMLSNDEVVNALIAAAKRGVKVRVMLEPNPYNPANPNSPLPINRTTAAKLAGTGVQVAWSDPQFRFTHSKTMVIDRTAGYVMTLNLTRSGTSRNREFAAIVTDEAELRDLNRLFQADWDHVPFTPRSKRMVVSPANAHQRLTDLISGAKKSLTIYDEILYDEPTQDLLGAKARAGVDVRVLMGDPVTMPGNSVAAARLKSLGVKARYITAPVVHAKMITADDATSYIGSVNLTSTSLLKNREVGILLSDGAHIGTLNGTFSMDWAVSQDFAPPAPGLKLPDFIPGDSDRG
jgi:phosphatidylserine/phosphatidylglycerophosphate/cardiolipin synthase-like enzyme